MEKAAETVVSADVRVGDPVWTDDRSGATTATATVIIRQMRSSLGA